MTQKQATEYLAECFWPGVREADLSALDERASASAAELSPATVEASATSARC